MSLHSLSQIAELTSLLESSKATALLAQEGACMQPCCRNACSGRRPHGAAARSAANFAVPAARACACTAGQPSGACSRSAARAAVPAALSGACFGERCSAARAWSAAGAAAQTAETPWSSARQAPLEQGADALNHVRLARVLQRKGRHALPDRTSKPGPGSSSAAVPRAPPQLQQQAAHAMGDGCLGGPRGASPRGETPATARRLPAQQLLAFEREGHTCTRRLLPAALVGDLARLVAREVRAALPPDLAGPLQLEPA